MINSTLLRCVRFRSEQSCAGIFIHSSLFQQAPPQNILRGGGYCSKEFGRPRTTAAAMADNCWVCTVEMHARRGAEITWIYPEEDASATRRAVFEAELPFACLGEASSSRARDVRDAAATRFVVASGERRYFGCAASRTDCGDGAARGARQRAVAIVTATPVFDLLAEKVLVLASLPPDDDDTRAALRAA